MSSDRHDAVGCQHDQFAHFPTPGDLTPVVVEDEATEEYDRGHPAVLGVEMAGVEYAAVRPEPAPAVDQQAYYWKLDRRLEATVGRVDDLEAAVEALAADTYCAGTLEAHRRAIEELRERFTALESRHGAGGAATVMGPVTTGLRGPHGPHGSDRSRRYPCAADAMKEVL